MGHEPELLPVATTLPRPWSAAAAKAAVCSSTSMDSKFDEIIAFLNRAVSDGEPVMLMGVSSSYLYLFDYLHEHDLTFALAPDSRLFDTGGLQEH